MDEVLKKLEKAVVGRRVEVRLILAALRSETPVLIEGDVGRGKTKVCMEIAKALGRPFYRVDGAPDITPSKIVGWFDPSLVLMNAEEAEKLGIKPGFSWDTFVPGPLTRAMLDGGILFINEGTRLPSDTWNVLLTAMDERVIHIPKLGEVRAKKGFSVIVTANPMEYAGTYPLPEAAIDRFVWVPMRRQDPLEEREIIKRELLARGYDHIAKNDELLDLIEMCVDLTYRHPDLVSGVSLRAGIHMGIVLGELCSEGEDWRNESILLNAALMAFTKKIRVRDDVTKTREQIVSEIVSMALRGGAVAQESSSEPFFRAEGARTPSPRRGGRRRR